MTTPAPKRGDIVRAKRLGWNEGPKGNLTDTDWLDPYDYMDDDVEGEYDELVLNDTGLVPTYTNYVVDGQVVDGSTVEVITPKDSLVASSETFHLPGKHDQNTHGRSYATPPIAPSDVMSPERRGNALSGDAVHEHAGYTLGSSQTASEYRLENSVVDYTSVFEHTNNALRDAAGDMTKLGEGSIYGTKGGPKIKNAVKNIDKLINKSGFDRDVVTYRGSTLKELGIAPSDRSRNLTGVSFQNHAYTSTSKYMDVAEMFAAYNGKSDGGTGVIMHVYSPKGSKGLSIDKRVSPIDKREGEVLLPHGTKFQVIADHGVKSVTAHGGIFDEVKTVTEEVRVIDVQVVLND